MACTSSASDLGHEAEGGMRMVVWGGGPLGMALQDAVRRERAPGRVLARLFPWAGLAGQIER